MQSVRLERVLSVANMFIDNDDGVEIELEIDYNYPQDEEDNEQVYSVEFTKNTSHLCRLFNDHELWIDGSCIILEDDFGQVFRMVPNFSIDISHLIKAKKSDQEIQEFLKFIQLQLIHFGADDETNE